MKAHPIDLCHHGPWKDKKKCTNNHKFSKWDFVVPTALGHNGFVPREINDLERGKEENYKYLTVCFYFSDVFYWIQQAWAEKIWEKHFI